jgi:hypothetical protein
MQFLARWAKMPIGIKESRSGHPNGYLRLAHREQSGLAYFHVDKKDGPTPISELAFKLCFRFEGCGANSFER